MKAMKGMCIALFGTLLLVAGSVSVWAQAAPQTGDQTKSDSSATKGKKKSTSKKPDAADKSATADSSTTPKKTRSKKSAGSTATNQPAAAPASGTASADTAKIKDCCASRHSGGVHCSGRQARRRACSCGSFERAARLKDGNRSTGASSQQRRHGLGEHGFRHLSQARHALVWEDQAREVHDGSRCRQGRLQGFRKKLRVQSFNLDLEKERRK
jgi:hypothetical protein